MVRFVTKTSWLLVVLAMLSLAATAGTWLLINQLNDMNWWVGHTEEVSRECEKSLICLMDCETAYRGYLIRPDKEYLEPYELCYKHAGKHIEKIKELTLDNPDQQALMPVLLELAREKIKFTQRALTARDRAAPNTPAADLIDLKPGKILMDKYRATIGKVIDNEDALLVKRKQKAERLQYGVTVSLVILTSIILALLALVFTAIRAYVKQQDRLGATLQTALDDALVANKVKTQFVNTMSHEVRTPMSGIIGLAEILTRQKLDPDSTEMAETLLYSAKQLLRILNDMLEFSRLEAGKVSIDNQLFAIRLVVNGVTKGLKREAGEKGVHIETIISSQVPDNVCGDELRVSQVLSNLLSNAIKFTSKGTIEVSVQPIADPKYQNGQVPLKFSVSDTGIGIPESAGKKLFQPFSQMDSSTTRKYGGTGLGLSICKELVELMNGEIGYESRQNGGSTFWFVIPFPESIEGEPCQST